MNEKDTQNVCPFFSSTCHLPSSEQHCEWCSHHHPAAATVCGTFSENPRKPRVLIIPSTKIVRTEEVRDKHVRVLTFQRQVEAAQSIPSKRVGATLNSAVIVSKSGAKTENQPSDVLTSSSTASLELPFSFLFTYLQNDCARVVPLHHMLYHWPEDALIRASSM